MCWHSVDLVLPVLGVGISTPAQQVEPNVLTDEDIYATMRDLEDVRAELDRLGDLSFARRRALIERMNITCRMKVKDGWHVLVVYVYTRKLDEVLLEESVSSRRRMR
jgi:hypothetical protein